jgi:hypothetical protein
MRNEGEHSFLRLVGAVLVKLKRGPVYPNLDEVAAVKYLCSVGLAEHVGAPPAVVQAVPLEKAWVQIQAGAAAHYRLTGAGEQTGPHVRSDGRAALTKWHPVREGSNG